MIRPILILALFSASIFCSEPTISPSTVPVEFQKVFKFVTSDNRLEWSATAFYVTDTKLLTAAHTLGHHTWDHFIKKNGTRIPVKVIKIDYDADIALLESETPNEHYELLKTNPIVAIGFQEGKPEISKLLGAQSVKSIVTDNVMVPGMSGCPIVNAMGYVIGMGVRGNGKDKCISVPSDILIKFIESK